MLEISCVCLNGIDLRLWEHLREQQRGITIVVGVTDDKILTVNVCQHSRIALAESVLVNELWLRVVGRLL